MKEFDSVIFDLDGTLWDATDVITQAWNEGFKQLQLGTKTITKKQIMDCMGLIIPDIAAKLFPEFDKQTQLDIMDNVVRVEEDMLVKKGGILYPDIKNVLANLKSAGLHVSVVSNCQAGYIETFVRAHGMEEYIDDMECPGNTGLLKADNINLVVRRNNLIKPVYVGDTIGDANSAKKAGVPFIFAAYGFGEVTDYDYKINNLKELESIVID